MIILQQMFYRLSHNLYCLASLVLVEICEGQAVYSTFDIYMYSQQIS